MRAVTNCTPRCAFGEVERDALERELLWLVVGMFLRSRCALIWHQLSYKCCRNSIRHGNSKHLEVLLHDASLIEQQHLEDLCLSYLSKERFSLFVVHKKRLAEAQPYLYYSGKRLEPIHLLILTINLVKPERGRGIQKGS